MLEIFASIFGDPRNRLSGINRQYDVAAGNLGQRGAQARGQAQSAAGGQAGSRGLLNPSAFINATGAQAYNPFVGAMQGLEGERAGALIDAEDRMRQLLFQSVMGAKQGQMQRDYAREQNKPGAMDWITALLPLLTAPMTGGTSLLGYLLPSGGGATPMPVSDWRNT